MILNRSRTASHELVSALGRVAKLSPTETRYLRLINEREKLSRRKRSTADLDLEIAAIKNSRPPVRTLDAAVFRVISDWHSLVIRELAGTPGFVSTGRWIAQRLRGKVSVRQVEIALKNLIEVGILARTADGVGPGPRTALHTKTDIPSTVIREHHKQMMARASEALEEQFVPLREFVTLTLAFSPSRISEAKSAIREFRDQFHAQFQDGRATEIYQMNIQFFEHTNGPLKIGGQSNEGK